MKLTLQYLRDIGTMCTELLSEFRRTHVVPKNLDMTLITYQYKMYKYNNHYFMGTVVGTIFNISSTFTLVEPDEIHYFHRDNIRYNTMSTSEIEDILFSLQTVLCEYSVIELYLSKKIQEYMSTIDYELRIKFSTTCVINYFDEVHSVLGGT